MAKYNHTTLAQFISLLTKALGDLENVRWTQDELKNIVEEAVLTFAALSGFWKEEISINTINTQRVYNLFDHNGLQIKPSITYEKVLNWLNRDLIENLTEVTPESELFTLNNVLDLIRSKFIKFQTETNLVLGTKELEVEAQNPIVKFPDEIIDLVRVVFSYEDDEQIYEVILERADEQELSYFDSNSLSIDAIPAYFTTVYGSPNEISLNPVPSVGGTLKLITVISEIPVEEIELNHVINLPNNLIPYLKFGVEADIFSRDGLLNDPARAEYCTKRWNEGVLIGKNFSAILLAKANDEVITTDSLNKMDSFVEPVSSDDPPTILGLAGYNIFQTDTIPTAIINDLGLLINRNAIIPINDEDFLDFEVSYIDPLLKYCIHLAQMKSGAYEINETADYLSVFVMASVAHNLRLQKRGITYQSLMGKTQREQKEKPKLVEQAVA